MAVSINVAVAKKLKRSIMHSQMEREKDIIDLESFKYTYFDHIDPTAFVHALYLLGMRTILLYGGELYYYFQYDTCGTPTTWFVGEF